MTTETTIKDESNSHQLNDADDDDDDDDYYYYFASTDDNNNADGNASVQLGFCVEIDNDEHLQDVAHRSPNYHDWDGGQVGGRPVWLDPEHLPSSIPCPNCCGSKESSQNEDKSESSTNTKLKNSQTPQQMRFICQIYAPVDYNTTDDSNNHNKNQQGIDNPDRSFHRSLYVFACPECCGSSASGGTTSGIRVLRCQLPTDNPYFPAEPHQEVNWQQHLPQTWNNQHVCAVCGLKATGKCPLQQAYFCGPHHQREYKRYNKASAKDNADSIMKSPRLPSVYHMTELVVEEEPKLLIDNINVKLKTADDEYDLDPDLEQDDLNEMVGANLKGNNKTSQDTSTMRFYQRIQERPDCRDQCLRYCRWPSNDNTILWIRQDAQPTAENIPACPYCGGPRQFEFQLMPQLLHYLLKNRPGSSETGNKKSPRNETDDNNGNNLNDWTQLKQALEQTDSLLEQAPPEFIPPDLVQAKQAAVERVKQGLLAKKHEVDWGVVAVYTCINSCEGVDSSLGDGGLGSYKEEYAWVQLSLDTI